jgi:predicted small secreted protein
MTMIVRSAKLLKFCMLLLPLLTAAAGAACSTVQGAGQDIRNAGAWIEKKANANK